MKLPSAGKYRAAMNRILAGLVLASIIGGLPEAPAPAQADDRYMERRDDRYMERRDYDRGEYRERGRHRYERERRNREWRERHRQRYYEPEPQVIIAPPIPPQPPGLNIFLPPLPFPPFFRR